MNRNTCHVSRFESQLDRIGFLRKCLSQGNVLFCQFLKYPFRQNHQTDWLIIYCSNITGKYNMNIHSDVIHDWHWQMMKYNWNTWKTIPPVIYLPRIFLLRAWENYDNTIIFTHLVHISTELKQRSIVQVSSKMLFSIRTYLYMCVRKKSEIYKK